MNFQTRFLLSKRGRVPGRVVLVPERTMKLSRRDPRSLSNFVYMSRVNALLIEEAFRH